MNEDHKKNIQAEINQRFGDYIKLCIQTRENNLRSKGIIKGKRGISMRSMAKEFALTPKYITDIVSGRVIPSDDVIIKFANHLDVDEHELFKRARRIHPDILKEMEKSYLGEFYVELD
jgi:hypothetical protein